jgi:hypothetical protein
MNSCNKGRHEYAIALQHGLYSRKWIHLRQSRKGVVFDIENCIDGSRQRLVEKQLFDEEYTNIGKAIQKGAFFALPPDA